MTLAGLFAALLLAAAALAAGRPEPAADAGLTSYRAAGLKALEEACRLREAGKPGDVKPQLLEAVVNFRKVLDLHVIDGEPADAWQDYFGQGRAMMLLDRADHAEPYLSRAEQLWKKKPDPGVRSPLAAILACRSYCYTRLGYHNHARLTGEQALEAGYRPAGLLNNLGHSSGKVGPLGPARRYLDEALRKSPGLYQALYNRCSFAHREWFRGRKPLPAWVLGDLEQALRLLKEKGDPESAELYRVAAQLYAQAAIDTHESRAAIQPASTDAGPRHERERRERAQAYFERAYVLGMDPGPQFNDDTFKKALGSWLTGESLAGLRQQRAQAIVSFYLLDPLAGALR